MNSFKIGLLAVTLIALFITGCEPVADGTGATAPESVALDSGEGDEASAAKSSSTSSDEVSNLSGKIEIDGSSTVYPISEAAAVEFRKKYPSVKITVGISGTGGGFKRFEKGETDISDASRPIKESEFKSCQTNKVEFIELPIAYDGLSIVVNPKNDFVNELTVDQLRKIFLDDDAAKTWRDVDSAWPAETIKVYAPGKDSGTFDYFFSDVVAPDGEKIRTEGVSFSEDDNTLVQGVSNEKYAVGFFGCSYYFENEKRLKAVKIVNPETKTAVAPTPESIESGEYAPFSRPLFIYVNKSSLERKPEMKVFVDFYLENSGRLAEKVAYVTLPEEVLESAHTHFQDRLVGTHYLTPESFEKRSGSLVEVYTEANLFK